MRKRLREIAGWTLPPATVVTLGYVLMLTADVVRVCWPEADRLKHAVSLTGYTLPALMFVGRLIGWVRAGRAAGRPPELDRRWLRTALAVCPRGLAALAAAYTLLVAADAVALARPDLALAKWVTLLAHALAAYVFVSKDVSRRLARRRTAG